MLKKFFSSLVLYVFCLSFIVFFTSCRTPKTKDTKNGSDGQNQSENEKNKGNVSSDKLHLHTTDDSSKLPEKVSVAEYKFEENDSIRLFEIEDESPDNKNFIFQIRRNSTTLNELLRVELKQHLNFLASFLGSTNEASEIGSLDGYKVSIEWSKDSLNFYVDGKDIGNDKISITTVPSSTFQFKRNNINGPLVPPYVLKQRHKHRT
ncbi:MAG: hypothetical protein LBD17_01740 [Endomicrobium sp.]|nr:hypothetical protein [Endomicrobium sp.]